MALKLPKLSPDLHRSLEQYCEVYRRTYGEEKAEPVAEIIPYILQGYLESDRGFLKAIKEERAAAPASK